MVYSRKVYKSARIIFNVLSLISYKKENMDSHKSELPLRIILDLPSLKNEYSKRIQSYYDNELFEFLAVGGSSRFTEVNIDFENETLWFERESLGHIIRE